MIIMIIIIIIIIVVIVIALCREAYLTIDSNDDVIAFHSYSDNRHHQLIIVNIVIQVIKILKMLIIINLREGEDSSINPCHIAKVLTFF